MLGGLLSLVIVTMRVSPHWLPNRFARAYILVFRGSPLLIQMFLVYYGLGQFGVIRESFLWPVLREPYMCAVLSLALVYRRIYRRDHPRRLDGRAGWTDRGGLFDRLVGLRVAAPRDRSDCVAPVSAGVFDRSRAARQVDRARESRHRVGSDRRRAADHPADLSDN